MTDYNTLLDMKDREDYAAWLKRPKCWECGEIIEEDFCYQMQGHLVCEHCMEGHRVDL